MNTNTVVRNMLPGDAHRHHGIHQSPSWLARGSQEQLFQPSHIVFPIALDSQHSIEQQKRGER